MQARTVSGARWDCQASTSYLSGMLIRQLLESARPQSLTVFHGSGRHADGIRQNGLVAGPMGYHSPGWYVVATDFESALFHATTRDGTATVFEFEVPVTNERWEGDPYFWPPAAMGDGQKWFALQRPLPAEFIKRVHQVSNKAYAEPQSGSALDESSRTKFTRGSFIFPDGRVVHLPRTAEHNSWLDQHIPSKEHGRMMRVVISRASGGSGDLLYGNTCDEEPATQRQLKALRDLGIELGVNKAFDCTRYHGAGRGPAPRVVFDSAIVESVTQQLLEAAKPPDPFKRPKGVGRLR